MKIIGKKMKKTIYHLFLLIFQKTNQIMNFIRISQKIQNLINLLTYINELMN